MNGTEWRARTRGDERARKEIPLEYTATMPLPVPGGRTEAACWHYLAVPSAERGSMDYQAPCLLTLWDAGGNLLEKRWLKEEPVQTVPAGPFLGTGAPERAYLEGLFTDWLEGREPDEGALREAWLRTAPGPVAEYLEKQQDV